MSVLLEKLAKLIALADPPASGSDEEAKRAGLAACALIRKHHLHVWDPSGASKQAIDPERSIQEQYASAVDANPTRVAMRQRQQDRLRHEQELEDAKSKSVG